MTQAELDILSAQKARAHSILMSIISDQKALAHTYWRGLDGTDGRVMEYVTHVATHPELHGIQEECVVIRYFRMLRTYQFRPNHVRAFIAHAEFTKQEGPSSRVAYKLTPVQVFIAAYVFGFATENGEGMTVRMIRTAFLLVARKFSKTGFACLIMSYYFRYYGDDNCEIYIGANSTQQANVAFRELSAQLMQYDPHAREKNSRQQVIRITENEITYRQSSRRQRPHRKVGKLSATSGTKDGLKPELGYIDEYAAAKDKPSQPGDALRNVIESGMGNRRQPLVLVTTTAGTVLDGPCIKEVEAYRDMLIRELECPMWSPTPTENSN